MACINSIGFNYLKKDLTDLTDVNYPSPDNGLINLGYIINNGVKKNTLIIYKCPVKFLLEENVP